MSGLVTSQSDLKLVHEKMNLLTKDRRSSSQKTNSSGRMSHKRNRHMGPYSACKSLNGYYRDLLVTEREIIGGLFDSFAARWINPEAPLQQRMK